MDDGSHADGSAETVSAMPAEIEPAAAPNLSPAHAAMPSDTPGETTQRQAPIRAAVENSPDGRFWPPTAGIWV
jgi:hypothetical protein